MMLRSSMLRIVIGVSVVALAIGVPGGRQLTSAAGSAGVAAQAALPTTGTYLYSVTGSECASVLFLQYCRNFPAQAHVVLTHKTDTITVEMDLSSNHLETSRYALHADGRYLTWQRTKLVFGIAQDDSAPTVPPTLALPSTLRVGQHWTQHFNTGGLPVTTVNTVLKAALLNVGGTSVAAYEIAADSVTGGAHPGTENDITWHAPGSGLDVRLIIHRRIKGAFPYKMDVDATLLSLKPLG